MKPGDNVRVKMTASDHEHRERVGTILSITGQTADVEFEHEIASHLFDLDELEVI